MKDNRSLQEKIYENQICSLVGKQLEKHYPGWKWWVECVLATGIVSIRNLELNGDYGFCIPLDKLLNETDPKIVMQACGEILERHRMDVGARKQFNIKRDFAGSAIGDIS